MQRGAQPPTAPTDGPSANRADHAQTVGATAIDCAGRLAAATSTGGRCGKFDGRVGDTPIIGAGEVLAAFGLLVGAGRFWVEISCLRFSDKTNTAKTNPKPPKTRKATGRTRTRP